MCSEIHRNDSNCCICAAFVYVQLHWDGHSLGKAPGDTDSYLEHQYDSNMMTAAGSGSAYGISYIYQWPQQCIKVMDKAADS